MRILFIILFNFLFITACFSQKNKNIIVAPADIMYYQLRQENNKQHKLVDLTKCTDSSFIRITLSFPNGNKISYELRKTSKDWQGRIICIGKGDFYHFDLGFVLFKRNHSFNSNKTKKANYKRQIKFDIVDFFDTYFVYELIGDTINPQPNLVRKLFQLKSQCELDSILNKTFVDSSNLYRNVEIEISTPFEYKYLYWPAAYIDSNNYYSDLIIDIYDDLFSLYYKSRENYIFINYHKNRWPKR